MSSHSARWAVVSLQVRYVIGIPESEKQFACGMRNVICDLYSTRRIRDPTYDCNPQSKCPPTTEIQPESRIHDKESKLQDFLGLPFMGELLLVMVFLMLTQSLMSYK